jgi:ubiquitin-conjugating enzyme E2 Q
MAQNLKKEIDAFLKDSDKNVADFELKKIKDDKTINFSIAGEIDFSVVVEGPKKFKVKCDLEELEQEVNKFCGKADRTISDVLTKIAEVFMSDDGEPADGGGEDMDDILAMEDEDDGIITEPIQPKKTNEKSDLTLIQEIEAEFNTKAHPNQVAIQRLIKDYLSVCKMDTQKLGYKAEPVDKNLFVWHVKMFGFKGSNKKDDIDEKNIADDLTKYAKQHKQDHILFEMTFPENYPYKPPFIRILTPRFVQYTGHVTIGGSICFELLTSSGWNPASSIEAILVQIRHQLIEGKARIDFHNQSPYTLHEAKDAYIRMAQKYGFKID